MATVDASGEIVEDLPGACTRGRKKLGALKAWNKITMPRLKQLQGEGG